MSNFPEIIKNKHQELQYCKKVFLCSYSLLKSAKMPIANFVRLPNRRPNFGNNKSLNTNNVVLRIRDVYAGSQFLTKKQNRKLLYFGTGTEKI
jgi:hypothetical protein